WPKPQSSIRMSKTFGAPGGALISGILSGTEFLYVGPMVPLKGGSGRGSTSCAGTGRDNQGKPSADASAAFALDRKSWRRFIGCLHLQIDLIKRPQDRYFFAYR